MLPQRVQNFSLSSYPLTAKVCNADSLQMTNDCKAVLSMVFIASVSVTKQATFAEAISWLRQLTNKHVLLDTPAASEELV